MSVSTDRPKSLFGYVAEFSSASDLYHAAEKVRDAGFRKWDVHTPFPIHGMDHAMGMGKSWLSAFVMAGGAVGALVAFGLQFFTQVVLSTTVVQNKPTNFFTVPAFFPVIFELTILLSAFTIVGTLFVMIMLPRWNHPLFESEFFKKFSDDGFMMVIETRDPKFGKEKTRSFLEEIGAERIEEVNA